jgi:putative lumazine-binding protein
MPTFSPIPSARRIALTIACVVAIPFPTISYAQSAADSAAIRAAALDYIEGWYTGTAERMERAVHPDLAKRIMNTDQRGRRVLGHQSAMTLVLNTRAGGGKQTPAAEQRKDVHILDIFGNAASVRIDAGTWVDYLHVARWNDRWVIVNVLWELRPQ